MDLKKYIRDIPDFPKKGILFHDVTTLFKSHDAFSYVIREFKKRFEGQHIDYIAGIEARGFIIGSALALELNCGFIPIRKPGKLPADVYSEEYALEYGTDTVEIHKDALNKGDKIILADDLVATGGTLLASVKLLKQMQAELLGIISIIDMPDLGGRMLLEPYNYQYLVEYLGD